jgi:hypothetical protein
MRRETSTAPAPAFGGTRPDRRVSTSPTHVLIDSAKRPPRDPPNAKPIGPGCRSSARTGFRSSAKCRHWDVQSVKLVAFRQNFKPRRVNGSSRDGSSRTTRGRPSWAPSVLSIWGQCAGLVRVIRTFAGPWPARDTTRQKQALWPRSLAQPATTSGRRTAPDAQMHPTGTQAAGPASLFPKYPPSGGDPATKHDDHAV